MVQYNIGDDAGERTTLGYANRFALWIYVVFPQLRFWPGNYGFGVLSLEPLLAIHDDVAREVVAIQVRPENFSGSWMEHATWTSLVQFFNQVLQAAQRDSMVNGVVEALDVTLGDVKVLTRCSIF